MCRGNAKERNLHLNVGTVVTEDIFRVTVPSDVDWREHVLHPVAQHRGVLIVNQGTGLLKGDPLASVNRTRKTRQNQLRGAEVGE